MLSTVPQYDLSCAVDNKRSYVLVAPFFSNAKCKQNLWKGADLPSPIALETILWDEFAE